jgi:phosphoglycerate dehydrogenase-like enzyme
VQGKVTPVARSGGPGGTIIVNAHPYGAAMADGIRAGAPGETVVPAASRDEVPDDARILATLLDEPDSIRELLVPSVEWVHALATGVDGFPFDALDGRVLTCSRGASAEAISEWVLAVMLAFVKDLPSSWIDSPPKRWSIASLGTLAGRTLGMVGLGAIGAAVARRALAFDMEVLALRRTPTPSHVDGVTLVSDLPELLGRADHVVVAAPATNDTHRLLDAAAFAAMKPGVHLVNIARGRLVDQEALRVALDDGTVARASLDTVDPEPLPAGHWLYTHPAVRLSAHISWSSPHTMVRTFEMFTENLTRFRAGQPLEGVVDPQAGY